jgi:hypothetical protein
MNTITTPWRGWYRTTKKQRWCPLAEAEDYGDALNALLDAVAEQPNGELLVSKNDPNTSRCISLAYSPGRRST